MSKKRRTYSAQFKAKVVLELLEDGKTINELASKYNILPKSIHQWKKQFFENASLAFENAIPAKKYKDVIEEKELKIDALSKALGQTTIERDWVLKKLRSLDWKSRKSLVESKLKNISITRQTELLDINRASLYYKHKPKYTKETVNIMNSIDEIYTIHPYYGYRRMHYALLDEGIVVNKKKVLSLMRAMNIQALYPKKKINTSIPRKENEKYPYLLRNLDIEKPNQVWASDITYIKLKQGFAYLCAVIDLHTRAILSHRLMTTMDETLVISTIKQAIEQYGAPEVFNSDQGSQYTSRKTIELLKKHNISISMDAKGRCFDNIYMERFWRSLKQENVYPSSYKNIMEARKGIDYYMKTYNNQRLHSSIGYKTPMEFYKQELKKAA
jgi:putative transposase